MLGSNEFQRDGQMVHTFLSETRIRHTCSTLFRVKLCLGSFLHSTCLKQTNRLAGECGVEGLSHVLGWLVKSDSYEAESRFRSRSCDREWQKLL